QVLELLNDADLATVSNRAPLSEIRTLALGFRDLGTSSAQPAPPAARPVVAPAPPPPVQPAVPLVYSFEDLSVVAPVPIRESLASLADVFGLRPGVLEIIVS